jgi:PhnB protein
MNITLPIGPNVLIGNDVPSFMGTVNENENRSKISIQAASKEEAEHLYTILIRRWSG